MSYYDRPTDDFSEYTAPYSSPAPPTPGLTDVTSPSTTYNSPPYYDVAHRYQLPTEELDAEAENQQEQGRQQLYMMQADATLGEWISNYLTHYRFRPLSFEQQALAEREQERRRNRRGSRVAIALVRNRDGIKLELPWDEVEFIRRAAAAGFIERRAGGRSATAFLTDLSDQGSGSANYEQSLAHVKLALLDLSDEQVTKSFDNKLDLTRPPDDRKKIDFIQRYQLEDFAIDEGVRGYLAAQDASVANESSGVHRSSRRHRRHDN